MTADQQAALDQWNLAYTNTEKMLLSIEHSWYTNNVLWKLAINLLKLVNSLIKGMLEK